MIESEGAAARARRQGPHRIGYVPAIDGLRAVAIIRYRSCARPAFADASRGGPPLYYDGDHVTGYTNDLLYPGFAAAVERIAGARTAE